MERTQAEHILFKEGFVKSKTKWYVHFLKIDSVVFVAALGHPTGYESMTKVSVWVYGKHHLSAPAISSVEELNSTIQSIKNKTATWMQQ